MNVDLPDEYRNFATVTSEVDDSVAVSIYWEPGEDTPIRLTVETESNESVCAYLGLDDAQTIAKAMLLATVVVEDVVSKAQSEIDRLRTRLRKAGVDIDREELDSLFSS